ncbi:GAP family protein [Mycobacterium sp. 94-17]|uniref:GAP family protein n=1 Tax=Mycobacterium sp. 94-17 TaxID=2986147 RepID=UPI002D1E7386|nr:GAP family protein [Mycobacterium sp. 94-17]MEB4209853.1 GAP family protein [Mycobacterium sp. 94-17]
MVALALALAGLAFLDSLNVLNLGVVSAVIFDSRLGRRSPMPGALSYIAGVFAVTTTFGMCAVLGLGLVTEVLDFHLTPAIRFRGELLLGLVLIGLAYFPLTAQSSAPGWALAAMRQRPWLLGFLGLAVGSGQAPTAVPYLTGLAMLAALHPRPPLWPLVIIGYWAIALSPPLLILALSTRKSLRAKRIQRAIVRALTRYGPISVRLLFLIFGTGLIGDALINHSALW